MHAEALLRAAQGEPEAGDHLVEDQQRAGRVAQLAHAARGSPEAGSSVAEVARDGLHQHGGDRLVASAARSAAGVVVRATITDASAAATGGARSPPRRARRAAGCRGPTTNTGSSQPW